MTVFLKSTLTAAALLAAFFLSSRAFAQAGVCKDREEMVRILGEKYGETPAVIGLAGTGKEKLSVMEVFASEDGETWTIVSTFPDGVSCIVYAGRFLEIVRPEPGQGS